MKDKIKPAAVDKKKDQVIHIDPKIHKDFKLFSLMQDSTITTEAEKALINHMHYSEAGKVDKADNNL